MKNRIIGITLALTLFAGAGVASASTYSSWKASFAPTLQQTITDYSNTMTNLSNGNVPGGINGFNKLAADSQNLYDQAHSPDASLNHDIRAFALSVSLVSLSGKNALSGKGTVSQFKIYVQVMNQFALKCASDLRRDNQRY